MTYEEAKATLLLEYCGERCGGYENIYACENCEIKIALDALNRANTYDFKHFKKYTDSTLSNMSKTELIDYINMLYKNWQGTDSTLNNAVNANYDLLRNIDNAIIELEEQRYYKAVEIVRKAVRDERKN